MSPPASEGSLSGAITSEGGLIETPGLDLLEELGWQHVDLMQEEPGPANSTGRLTFRDVILPARFRTALRKLNPSLPLEALQEAELVVTANRSAMLPVAANRDVYRLLREGVPVELRQPDGSSKPDRVALIDWANATRTTSSWLAVLDHERTLQAPPRRNRLRQRHPTAADGVQGPHEHVQEAYENNLRDYRDTIPHLFHSTASRSSRTGSKL